MMMRRRQAEAAAAAASSMWCSCMRRRCAVGYRNKIWRAEVDDPLTAVRAFKIIATIIIIATVPAVAATAAPERGCTYCHLVVKFPGDVVHANGHRCGAHTSSRDLFTLVAYFCFYHRQVVSAAQYTNGVCPCINTPPSWARGTTVTAVAARTGALLRSSRIGRHESAVKGPSARMQSHSARLTPASCGR